MNEAHLERAREIGRSLPPLTDDQKRKLRLLLAPAVQPQKTGGRQ